MLQPSSGAKIGTDGVLLGAWAKLEQDFESFLDIGTGSGVIALMLAQRTNKFIDAVEIDTEVAKTAAYNFSLSPWKDTIALFKGDFLSIAFSKRYDAIVSNPPFYKNIYPIKNKQRAMARDESYLSFRKLLQKVSLLLSSKGIFSVIVPYAHEEELLSIGLEVKLYPKYITRVQGNEKSKVKRSLIAFTLEQVPIQQDFLIIEKSRHCYTKAYRDLVKDYYLKM